jgi:hypothetical protein
LPYLISIGGDQRRMVKVCIQKDVYTKLGYNEIR